MTGLIVSCVVGLAAYVWARTLAARWELDPKPRGALVLTVTLLAGALADAVTHMITKAG